MHNALTDCLPVSLFRLSHHHQQHPCQGGLSFKASSGIVNTSSTVPEAITFSSTNADEEGATLSKISEDEEVN